MNPTSCSCKNVRYLENIINDSVIMCDVIIEETKKTVLTNLNDKK